MEFCYSCSSTVFLLKLLGRSICYSCCEKEYKQNYEEWKKRSNKMKYETKDSGKREVFESGLHRDSGLKPLYTEVYYPLVKRHAELMMRGAVKYERGNWKKACTDEDLERFKDALLRHTYQYLNGEVDEDHLAAILFNAHGCAMIEDKTNGGEQ